MQSKLWIVNCELGEIGDIDEVGEVRDIGVGPIFTFPQSAQQDR